MTSQVGEVLALVSPTRAEAVLRAAVSVASTRETRITALILRERSLWIEIARCCAIEACTVWHKQQERQFDYARRALHLVPPDVGITTIHCDGRWRRAAPRLLDLHTPTVAVVDSDRQERWFRRRGIEVVAADVVTDVAAEMDAIVRDASLRTGQAV